MKERKGNIKWILLVAALAVLLLLLTMCTGRCSAEPEETQTVTTAAAAEPTESSAVTEQTEETTQPAQETTVPTEETTAPTEEATEETTAPTSATEGTEPDDEDYGEEEEYVEVPYPGTPENPYVEVREEYPAQVVSVNIPENTEVCYQIFGSAGSVITIREPGVTLTMDGKTYTADETTGELTVDLSKLGTDSMIRLSHSGTAAASCVLNLAEGFGGAGNPEPLTNPVEQEILLPEGDANGYHYKWTSTVTGQVELTLKEKEAEEPEETTTPPAEETEGESGTEETQPSQEEPVLEILVTIGEQVIRLSDFEDGKLIFDAVKDQEVVIQVIAQPYEDGTYPEIEETILWTLLPAPGTAENPQTIDSIVSIPAVLEKDDVYGIHYRWTSAEEGTVSLTADNAALDVVVTLGETVYRLSEADERILTFRVEEGQTVDIQVIAIPETGEEGTDVPVYPAVSGTITGTFLPDPGAPENPEVLESIETIAASLEEGDSDGHTFQWTAPYGGTLEITAENAVGYDVILTNTDSTASQRLSEQESGPLTAEAEAGDVLTILVIALPEENGSYGAVETVLKGSFTAIPGSSQENPIEISDPASGATFAMEPYQTLYFSGMVHEMIATVEDASGVSIRCGEETVWGSQTGVAAMEFPSAVSEEPVVFSVTSKNGKELTMSFAYPVGHGKNPAQLTLGENKAVLEENDEDGYLFQWTADCDGQLTVAVSGKGGWQYRLDDLTAGISGQMYTSRQEPQTLEVKAGTKLALTLWTLGEEEKPLPAGTLTVSASFFDPLLGTEAKPIRLEAGESTPNTVTVSAGQTLYYTADAEGMVLTFEGREVTLLHSAEEHLPENGTLQLLCHGVQSLFQIRNDSDKDQVCRLSFAYPQGHRKNPAPLIIGENTALLQDGALSGYAFAWTAESSGELTVSMDEGASWQYILTNETTGVGGVVHTSEDQPSGASETLEVTKGDRILVIVNTFDLEHPLKTPAGEVVFTVAFVDPTLGMEENPIWLNLEDEIAVPAGKTMYCTAKADGMILTLKGSHVTVSHNGTEYSEDRNVVTLLCQGTGTFGHPVFAVTNTGTEAGVYSISFAYPEGHFLNPASLELKEITVSPEKNGYYLQWTAETDGTFTFTMNTQSGWKYMITNVTTGEAGETRFGDAEDPLFSEILEVSAGDQLRILVNVHETQEEANGNTICFSAAFVPKE